MEVALIFLLTISFGVASIALTLATVSRISRWAEGRYVPNLGKNRAAMRMIPKAQLIAVYLAFALVLFAFLAWNWSAGSVKSASAILGLIALVYIGWFSIRWRHLR
ncbi:hypothetical protein [Brevundimonas sp.]|uniref:hypothetical protein n=1 Tax=Brevundimonas sp. TaxID=1871086 RepID=UPI001213ECBB|nr:hypothetical protein [Brevundimonas sp.]TAJ62924.1 MAG: hypothetical protein EPO49_07980 [Brevundimonas sp.]